jgi:phosphohistidine phosphatase SixA
MYQRLLKKLCNNRKMSLVSKGCSYQGNIVLNQSLYEAKPKDYVGILERLSDRYDSVSTIGHNPTVEDIIYTNKALF